MCQIPSWDVQKFTPFVHQTDVTDLQSEQHSLEMGSDSVKAFLQDSYQNLVVSFHDCGLSVIVANTGGLHRHDMRQLNAS